MTMSRLLWFSLFMLLGAVAVGIYWNYDGFDPESLRGATVVITGCSTGIGEEMAYQYARLGAKILITARRENRLKEVVAKAKSLGAQEAHYVAGDMGKAEDCERTIQTAKEKFGRLDYLVLNHMGSSFKSLQQKFIEGTLTSWDQDPDVEYLVDFLNINLVSYVRLASLALPLLKESSGHIVAVSSAFGKMYWPNLSFYSCAKFGLDGFFSSLRVELMKAQQDVSVTLVVLGKIGTPKISEKLQDVPGGDTVLEGAALKGETALVIIRGGATRAREVYYPFYTWPMAKLSGLMPQFVDYLAVRVNLLPES
ncbi:hydroxysteroid 11-beta-dehydrogenase 1-like protein isoform X1 [Branchiostoma lanceolatum]|uniref:hydroxysteroid 11-beta-dehydrogenase 1-like protein isoform X1 n=1 Tax=Branchiostoma lanceolatum TaxID=7740 RepID=UPI003452CC7E